MTIKKDGIYLLTHCILEFLWYNLKISSGFKVFYRIMLTSLTNVLQFPSNKKVSCL